MLAQKVKESQASEEEEKEERERDGRERDGRERDGRETEERRKRALVSKRSCGVFTLDLLRESEERDV